MGQEPESLVEKGCETIRRGFSQTDCLQKGLQMGHWGTHGLILPRRAMHKRGLCRRAVSVRLSVLTFVCSVETGKHISKKLFTVG